MATPLLELRNVTKKFGGSLLEPDKGVIALDDISLSIETDTPTLLTVAGESGSGKSTMGYTLLGFHEPTKGEVLYNGKNLQKLSRGEKWQFRQEVQAIFQDPFAVYNPFYKVDHLLRVPLRRFKLATSRKEVQMKIEEALESVGLRPQETLGRFPHQLSGGQRQRLVVARALLMRPKLIVADEPVSMVDASLRATILEALRTIKDEFGISIFYVTHDLTTAYHISDNILILYQGSIREAGDVDLVIKDPKDPYTQLLIRSIPWPDISRRWGRRLGTCDARGRNERQRHRRLQVRRSLPPCHGHLSPGAAAAFSNQRATRRLLLSLRRPADVDPRAGQRAVFVERGRVAGGRLAVDCNNRTRLGRIADGGGSKIRLHLLNSLNPRSILCLTIAPRQTKLIPN